MKTPPKVNDVVRVKLDAPYAGDNEKLRGKPVIVKSVHASGNNFAGRFLDGHEATMAVEHVEPCDIRDLPEAERLPLQIMQAKAKAAAIGLPAAVRTIAKSGEPGEELDFLRFAPTAIGYAVEHPEHDVLIYSDADGSIQAFRDGPWVEKAIARAREIEAGNEKRAADAAADALRNEAKNFDPCHY